MVDTEKTLLVFTSTYYTNTT